MSYSDKRSGKGNYFLKNVRLETGFRYADGEITETQTDLFYIEIGDGKIKRIEANNARAEAIDAKGTLMLPAFRDMHTHLDKSLYGLPWKAVSGKGRTVKEMIALEQKIIPELLQTSIARSQKLIELLQSYGIGHARSHFNIEPTSGLRSLEHLQAALENKKDSFSAELVAFPQHGIYYTHTAPLMEEAARFNCVQFMGGLDPSSIDGSIEKPMDFIIQLALEHHKGIDIHLHETGPSGMKTIEYLINRVLENPELRGRTYISHAFVLGCMAEKEVERIAEKLADAKIGIATAMPYGSLVMPLPILWKYGVEVLVGNDNIQDHWGTLGSGNLLQKANLAAGLYGMETEWELSRLLKVATNNLLPLDDEGRRQWPKPGDWADMVFVDASCSAEAVSRVSPVRSLVHKGTMVF